MTLRRAIVSLTLFFLFVGAPRADTTHTVRRGQTLFSIARTYGVTVQRLAAANKITDPSRVTTGQRLIIPQPKGIDRPSGAKGSDRPPGTRGSDRPSSTKGIDRPAGAKRSDRPPGANQPDRPSGSKGADRPSGRNAPPQPRPSAVRKPVPARLSPAVTELFSSLQWPVEGPVISTFAAPRRGPRQHKGIDIKSPEGAPVKAVADGVVTLAQDHHGLYGRLIVLNHGAGVTSYYGHNSRNLVEEGQRVSAGEVIALVGRSGNASTEHLHFELRVEGAALDPAKLLPDPSSSRVTTAVLPAPPPRPVARPATGRKRYPPEPGKGPPPE